MQTERPYVLTIAGLDPSSGAGLTADIKTFEQLKVYGLAVCTGLTLQTEDEFLSVKWRDIDEVKIEIELLLNKYPVKAIKFGIVPSFEFLSQLINSIKNKYPQIKIVVDPVWKSSTGFVLNESGIILNESFLKQITLITPNVPELEFMCHGNDTTEFINNFAQFSNILVKGGHNKEKVGVDTLYQKNKITELVSHQKNIWSKHGSGCVLSAAITANLTLGKDLKEACSLAKNYIEKYLSSNNSLLGYHVA
jgi:hydroxymethylpyrimidine/phosphomethylpyrimidine kinase